MKRILCVEDNQEMIHVLKGVLKSYHIEVAQNIKEARSTLEKEKFDLITLDLGLPDGDGIELLREWTSSTQSAETPIFILSSNEETTRKVSAFKLGAYDYIVKPFEAAEFLARIEAIFRRIDGNKNKLTSLKMGDITLSIPKQKVWIDHSEKEVESEINIEKQTTNSHPFIHESAFDHKSSTFNSRAGKKEHAGTPISLTSLEFRLLLNLVQAQGKVLSRTELLKDVWGEEMHVTDRTVDTHIGHLRKKIKHSKVQIQTVVGEGYRLALTQ